MGSGNLESSDLAQIKKASFQNIFKQTFNTFFSTLVAKYSYQEVHYIPTLHSPTDRSDPNNLEQNWID